MEAKELMIGDWVQDTYPNGKKFYTKVNIPVFCNYLRGDEVHPIPLTPEILEKNGFDYDGLDEEGNLSYAISLKKGAYEARYYVWGYLTEQGFDIAFGANNQPCELYLRYVHELQHALHLCGMTELADNFKV